MRFGPLVTSTLLVLLVSGCTSPATPASMGPGHEWMAYRLTITSNSGTDEFHITLGTPFEAETAYPNGQRSLALIRPLQVERRDVDQAGPGMTFATQYAACNGPAGFCTTAVAIDPSTGRPIRLFHTPIDVFTRSPLEDGSARSDFLSDRNDLAFWPLSPIFIGDIWRHTNGNLDTLYGRPVDISAAHTDDGIDIAYHSTSKWHDVASGDNVSISMKGTVRFEDGADPTTATLINTEKAPGHFATIEYRFVRAETSGANVDWPDRAPLQTAAETIPCGNGVQGRLFAESRLAYADAFAAVQQDQAYQSAHAKADAMLVAARLPAPSAGSPLDPPVRIWEFDVQTKQTLTTYRVEERYTLPESIPQEPEFTLLDTNTGPPDLTMGALREAMCLPWRAVEARISEYLTDIGADGYRQALIERMPADLAFRYTDGQRIPEAEAYAVRIQPFVDDGNGGIATGPRMAFSVVTGDITRIT